ncbi:hypothetical protein [Halosimplex salinum]|nr:hypothetical protein [Halosimplex salinum]
MTTTDEDTYVRQGVIITFLWLLAMLVGGVLLLRFGDVIQSVFA